MPNYFDNAATSFPKPESVYAAIDNYNRTIGAPSGRGGYNAAQQTQRALMQCRGLLSNLFGVRAPQNVVLTFSCTDSLNTVLHGVLRSGDHVVTTQLEHNSVLRPLKALESQGVESTVVPVGADQLIDPTAIAKAVKSNTKLIACLHASNVTGVVQPVAEIGQVAAEHGVLFLLDAAQTTGQLPVTFEETQADFIVAAGHKSLLGPLGTGVLCIRPGVEARLRSFRQGGTGSTSELSQQPDQLPDKYESGNLNMPGVFGLLAGLQHIAEVGVAALNQHKRHLIDRLQTGLRAIEGVTVYGTNTADRACVQSINIAGFEPQDVAMILDQNFDIQCRAGLHCAPGAHQALGTFETGGTVRLSPGAFTTDEQIELAITAIAEIAMSSP